jgi:phosphoserine phosphatase RsbU/P
MVVKESIDYGMFIQSSKTGIHEPENSMEKKELHNNFKVLKKYTPHRSRSSQAIARIITQYYYISQDEKIEDLADDIKGTASIRAVGVVDNNNNPVGVIVINDLLMLLSRPYGREVLKNHPVTEVMQGVRLFSSDRHILSVSEEIYMEMKSVKTSYFCLINQSGSFAGIFSTRNMLIYLSEITRKDIILAKTVQNNIMKGHQYIKNPNFEFLGFVCMAKEIGGDFYYIKNYTKNKWIISICDVSGKGIAASLITSVIGGMMDIYDYSKSLDYFLTTLNDYIFNSFGLDRFVTGIFMQFDEETGKVIFHDFGHSYLYIMKNNKILSLRSIKENIPLGIQEHIIPGENRFSLEKGDILLLLTDGFFDQKNDNKKNYSIQRIMSIIKKNKEKPFNRIKTILLDDFHTFRGNQPQIDDITLVMLRYK